MFFYSHLYLYLHGRNPLYLLVIFVAFLLLKALWVQLDISGEFRNGAVSVNFCSNCLLFSHPSLLNLFGCLQFGLKTEVRFSV